MSPANNASSVKSPGFAQVQSGISASNISSALNTIAAMKNSHTNFPTSLSNLSTGSNPSSSNDIGGGGSTQASQPYQTSTYVNKNNVYDNYEPSQSNIAYNANYNASARSPTNTNKYAQYIPREIPLHSNNINSNARHELGSRQEMIDTQFKKKDINIITNSPEINFTSKNKFTPTNNTPSTTAVGSGKPLASVSSSSGLNGLKKPIESSGYLSAIKPNGSTTKVGMSQSAMSRPSGK